MFRTLIISLGLEEKGDCTFNFSIEYAEDREGGAKYIKLVSPDLSDTIYVDFGKSFRISYIDNTLSFNDNSTTLPCKVEWGQFNSSTSVLDFTFKVDHIEKKSFYFWELILVSILQYSKISTISHFRMIKSPLKKSIHQLIFLNQNWHLTLWLLMKKLVHHLQLNLVLEILILLLKQMDIVLERLLEYLWVL